MLRTRASKLLLLLPIALLIATLLPACKTATKEVRVPDYRMASDDLAIPRLRDIPQSAHFDYMDYVSEGKVYIIVHPSYFFFFQDKAVAHHRKNSGAVYDYMVQQLTNEQKFLTHAREEKILVILVTPGDKLPLEYVNYLNEVTARSVSIVFVESKKMNAGTLWPEDELLLKNFLDRLGVDRIILGGGYIGRCQGHVYNGLSSIYNPEQISIAPEISTFSPGDISAETLEWFMTPSRNFDLGAVASFIDANRKNKINSHARVTPISSGPHKLDLCLYGWKTDACDSGATALVSPPPMVF